MAFLGQEFRSDDLPPAQTGDYQPVPDGWYEATITNAEGKATKAGTGHMVSMRFDIAGPTHNGRVIFTNFNVSNPNPEAERIGRQQLNSMMSALGIATLRDSEQVIGKKIGIKIVVKGDGNEIKAYRALSGSSMPAPKAAVQSFSNPQTEPAQANKVAAPWAK